MRTTNTFGIQFIIRKNKVKDNLAPVYVRITVDGHRVEISLKHWINPDDWNSSKGMTRGNHEETRSLYHYQEGLRANLMQSYEEMQVWKSITAEAIKSWSPGEC